MASKFLKPRPAAGLAGVLALLAGQYFIFHDKMERGVVFSLLGAALLLAAWVLPHGLWGSLRRRWAEMKRAAANLKRPAVAGRARQASLVHASLQALPRAAGASVGAFNPLQAWRQWRPLTSGELRLSRLWLVGLGLAGELGCIPLLLRGSLVPAILWCLCCLLPVAVYLQDMERDLHWARLNEKLRTLLLFCAGLVPQIFSVRILLQYQHVWLGYFITAVSVAWQLWVLSRYPSGMESSASLWQEVNGSWLGKPILALLALLGALLANGVLYSKNYYASVALNFASMALLVASFPWLPFSLRSLKAIPAGARGAAGLGLALLAFYLGYRGQLHLAGGQMSQGLWLYLGGGVCLALALPRNSQKSLQAWGNADTPARNPLNLPEQRLEIFLVCLLILAGFAFRFWHVGIFPWCAEGDEAGGGLWALDALHGRVDNPIISGNVPLFFFSVSAFFFRLWGVTVASLRAHAVIFGTLSLGTFYFFCRLFWGRLAAFVGAALMAFSYWHLHYSRFGHFNIEQVCMEMAAFYFFFKAERSGKFWQAVAGGVALALAMMPHLASRLLPFSFVLYFTYLILYQRPVLAQRFRLYLAFVLGAWMVLAPCLVYWVRVTSVSMGRAASVSIFDKTNTNAPSDTVAGFVNNCKSSMLMFNSLADTRTRDNPVAPEQILEFWTSILFALSFLYVLYRWREPIHFFLLACFFINLSASIFSVEAPQTLRTAGNIAIVYAMMTASLGAFRSLLEEWGTRLGRSLFAALALFCAVFFSYRSAHKYFVDYKNQAFDVLPTLVSEQAGRRSGKNYTGNFWSEGFVDSHPPVVLFKQDTPLHSHSDLTEVLPLRADLDKNQLLELTDRFQEAAPYISLLYPGAKREDFNDIRFGNRLGVVFDISKEQAQVPQGCEATAYPQGGLRGTSFSLGRVPVVYPLPNAAGNPQAKSILWEGSLWIPSYGNWQLYGRTQGRSKVWLDGREVSSCSSGHLQATRAPRALGLHTLRVEYEPPAAAESFSLSLDGLVLRPEVYYNLKQAQVIQVDPHSYFAWKQPMGLLGSAYLSGDFSGTPVMQVIQPQLVLHYLDSPISGLWSANWKGQVHVDQDSNYQFLVQAAYFAEVLIDGKVVARNGNPLVPVLKQAPVEANPRLKPGWHAIEARFATRSNMNLDVLWQNSSGLAQESIPADHLRPAL